MSFTTFGPLPTPPKAPISGLPGLSAAIRRLEATTPTPASKDAACHRQLTVGATPPCAAPLASVRLLSEMLLGGIDQDVRPSLRRAFARTLEAVEADLALPPERRRLVPKSLLVQQRGRPCAEETAQRYQQGQQGVERLLRQALWRAVDALEAAALLPPGEVYLSLLAERCAQFARVYQVLKGRVGRCFALAICEGSLRLLLHHRSSRAVEHLLFS